MDFLFQFQVDAKEVYYNDPMEFKLEKIEIILYLNESVEWISKGEKAHISVDGADKNDAYQKIWREIWDFNNRLIFLTGEEILITHLEFILLGQTGQEIRDIFFRDIKMPGNHELNRIKIEYDMDFIAKKIPETNMQAIRFFNQAVISSLPNEKYKSLFLSLEELVGSKLVEAKCDSHSCEGILECPVCGRTKKYNRVSSGRIDEFIQNSYYSKELGLKILPAKTLIDIRSKLSHSNRGISKKRSIDINDINSKLSLLIRLELERKYGITWPGNSVVKYGAVAGIDRQFRTLNKDDKFALDIPSINELKNGNGHTRWIF